MIIPHYPNNVLNLTLFEKLKCHHQPIKPYVSPMVYWSFNRNVRTQVMETFFIVPF